MITETINGITKLTASEGNFLANSDMTLYGESIWLGDNDSANNYTEHPLSEMPQPEVTSDNIPLTEQEQALLQSLLARQQANA